MKLWIDDVRQKPEGYDIHCKSVDEAKSTIISLEKLVTDVYKAIGEYVETNIGTTVTKLILEINNLKIELIDIDHDAGDYVSDGGDYIKLLDWLEETGRNYPIHIHSMNPVGVENMRRIIQRNGWKEV